MPAPASLSWVDGSTRVCSHGHASAVGRGGLRWAGESPPWDELVHVLRGARVSLVEYSPARDAAAGSRWSVAAATPTHNSGSSSRSSCKCASARARTHGGPCCRNCQSEKKHSKQRGSQFQKGRAQHDDHLSRSTTSHPLVISPAGRAGIRARV